MPRTYQENLGMITPKNVTRFKLKLTGIPQYICHKSQDLVQQILLSITHIMIVITSKSLRISMQF